jgi:hypothetical protein
VADRNAPLGVNASQVTKWRRSVEYLIVDVGMPEPHGKIVWSPRMENATSFSSSESAAAEKDAVASATGITEFEGKWYVVKESK